MGLKKILPNNLYIELTFSLGTDLLSMQRISMDQLKRSICESELSVLELNDNEFDKLYLQLEHLITLLGKLREIDVEDAEPCTKFLR